MEYVNWVATNWDTMLAGIAGVIAGASIIAKLTPTPKDDVILAKIVKFIDILALNKSR